MNLELLTDDQLRREIAECQLRMQQMVEWGPEMDKYEQWQHRCQSELDRRISIFRNGGFPGGR